jgi:hypothetical protein
MVKGTRTGTAVAGKPRNVEECARDESADEHRTGIAEEQQADRLGRARRREDVPDERDTRHGGALPFIGRAPTLPGDCSKA